jgi:hypothetical protein
MTDSDNMITREHNSGSGRKKSFKIRELRPGFASHAKRELYGTTVHSAELMILDVRAVSVPLFLPWKDQGLHFLIRRNKTLILYSFCTR